MSAVSALPDLTRCPSVTAATSIVAGSVLGWNTSRRKPAKIVIFVAFSPSSCAPYTEHQSSCLLLLNLENHETVLTHCWEPDQPIEANFLGLCMTVSDLWCLQHRHSAPRRLTSIPAHEQDPGIAAFRGVKHVMLACQGKSVTV